MNLKELQNKLRANPRPVIIDFWAPWCAPCRISKPILESIAREYDGRVDFWKIDADEHPELLHDLRIFSIPTVLLTRNGEVVSMHTGSQPRENYRVMFEVLTHPGKTMTVSMSAFDRLFRVLAGATITLIGLSIYSWLLVALGMAIAFLGIYDRCPIWQMLTARFTKKMP